MSIRDGATAGAPVRETVIDAHTHIMPLTANGYIQFGEGVSDMISLMDKIGINCVVTAPSLIIKGANMAEINNAAARAAEEYKGRIYGYISILPFEGIDEVKKQIARYSGDPSFIGFKFLTGYHGPLLQKEYEYALDFALEVKCPVVVHKWSENPPLSELAAVMKTRRELKLICAHLGGGFSRYTETYTALMKEYPNMRIDSCGSLNTCHTLEDIVELSGEDRIIFGSDAGCLDPRYDLGKITLSPVNDKVKQRILAQNYLDLLTDTQMGKILV